MIKDYADEQRYDIHYKGWSKNNIGTFKQSLSDRRAVNEKYLAKGPNYRKLSCLVKRPS